jgi:hypothetical protein
MPKQQSILFRIMSTVATTAGALGIFGVIDIIIDWVTGG